MAADKKGQKYWKDNYAPKLIRDKDYLQRHYKGTRHSTEYYQRVYRDGEDPSTRDIAKGVKRDKQAPRQKKQQSADDFQSAFIAFAIIIMFLSYYFGQ